MDRSRKIVVHWIDEAVILAYCVENLFMLSISIFQGEETQDNPEPKRGLTDQFIEKTLNIAILLIITVTLA